MSVLDLAVRRYPRYRNVFRRFRRYVKFQYLVFGWHHPSNEIEFEKDFRADAGYWRWLYMRAVRRMLTDPKLMDATRGLRRIFKAVVVR
jgi:hypothetical protein